MENTVIQTRSVCAKIETSLRGKENVIDGPRNCYHRHSYCQAVADLQIISLRDNNTQCVAVNKEQRWNWSELD